MLLEEKRLAGETSLLGHMDKCCGKYDIPPVSSVELDKGLVKQRIKLLDEIEIWMENIRSPVTRNVGPQRLRLATNMFRLTKRESQALIAYNAGAFKLKTAWGNFFRVKKCLAPLCDGPDSLSHIKSCKFYKTVWDHKFDSDPRWLAKYLVNIDRERRRCWRGECLF